MDSILINNKKECCGCTSCYATCPVKAISMKTDEEGFYYPQVDKAKCINCGKCVAVCPMKSPNKDKPLLILGVKNKDTEDRLQSRSGGFFQVAVEWLLKKNGVVYGCLLDSDLIVRHARADNKKAANRFCGSKYVQSDIGDMLLSINEDLKNGLYVMFSGTPCQVDGVQHFVNPKYRDHLILVDIVCHGVPSPLILSSYFEWARRKFKIDITGFDFRNKKKYGWADHVETIYSPEKAIDLKVYTRLFYKHQCMRPSCYDCPYKSVSHPSDITLADFWGIDKVNPSFNDNKGVSLVLINTEVGNIIFQETMSSIDYFLTNEDDACIQKPFSSSIDVPPDREKFWLMLRNQGFEKIATVYGEDNFVRRFKDFAKRKF